MINRDANGNPTSIAPPFAQPTMLTVDTNGYLKTVTDPANQRAQFTYSPQGLGLMTSVVDRSGGIHTFQYDTLGRLVLDQDPVLFQNSIVAEHRETPGHLRGFAPRYAGRGAVRRASSVPHPAGLELAGSSGPVHAAAR